MHLSLWSSFWGQAQAAARRKRYEEDKLTHYRRKVEEIMKIEISQGEFDDLRELQEQNPHFRFSCNRHEVWIARKQGFDAKI